MLTCLLQILFMTDDQMTQARSLAASQTTETSSWTGSSTQAMTATIGHFGHPINCAVSSPDGKYVAAVGDAPRAWIVSAKHGYEWIVGKSRTFAFGAKRPMRSRSDTHLRQDVSPGKLLRPFLHSRVRQTWVSQEHSLQGLAHSCC